MGEEQVERRLAAILAADVVGYSRLMEANEERTMGALRQHRREFFDPTVAKHGGRIFKVMGDGFLVEFGSVLNAARCAVEIQRGMPERNAGVPEDRHIKFRIGINLGDIIVEGDDFYGDGVNMAARLEGLAGPGGIACSAVVRNQVGNKLELEFLDQGEKTVKNIAQPVHVYFINLGGVPQRRASGRGRRPSACALRQAVGGDPAVLQHEQRPRAGVLQRRHHRGHHHRPVEGFGPVRARPQYRLHLQGQGRRTWSRSPSNWASPMWSRAASARPGTGCGSTPS